MARNVVVAFRTTESGRKRIRVAAARDDRRTSAFLSRLVLSALDALDRDDRGDDRGTA
jgi:hypothetical protein